MKNKAKIIQNPRKIILPFQGKGKEPEFELSDSSTNG